MRIKHPGMAPAMRAETDKCVYCDHPRSDHHPPNMIDVATSGGSSGKSKMVLVIAKTCCYSNPLCCCTAFVNVDDPRPYWFEYSKRFLSAV